MIPEVRGKAAQELAAVALAAQKVKDARREITEALKAAKAAGATNQEIGDVLGVTRQRVSQMLQVRHIDE